MLELQNISRIYEIGKPKDTDYQQVRALDGVSVQFRKSEFVSVLGPSGCGKTTMLNIIGGLDKYTSGDLIINQISTKEYKDSDWDNYRNNRIGFVFQSYNLIEHLTVLENVELALTLSGVKKAERKQKAKQALIKVGLGDKVTSKPNQLSGGQMQRVAIARALVNNPEIILADEPTGALDTQTSLQVMELLKEVAQERLVIMVTHNPEIANKYSTRIIKMLDGKLIGDSNPITVLEQEQILQEYNQQQEELLSEKQKLKTLTKKEKRVYLKQQKAQAKKRKRKMSFFTALSLSFKNLLTKKARTFLVSMAGSIGIIGIALILSLSSGFQMYIDSVQKDTLSNYPITINQTSADYTKLLESLTTTGEDKNYDSDKVYSNNVLADMLSVLQTGITINDLKSFKQYIETQEVKAQLKDKATVKYTYDLDFQIFNNNAVNIDESKSLKVNPFNMINGISGGSAMGIINETFQEMLDSTALLESQYNLVDGAWAKPEVYTNGSQNIAEVMIVLDKNNSIPDYALIALGLRDRKDIDKIVSGSQNNIDEYEVNVADLIGTEFNLVLNPDMYSYDNQSATYKTITTNTSLNPLYKIETADETTINNLTSVVLKVVGVIKPNPNATATSISATIGYTKGLTEYVVSKLEDYKTDTTKLHNILLDQLKPENSNRSVLTGKYFELSDVQIYQHYVNNQELYNALSNEEQELLTNFANDLIEINTKAVAVLNAFEVSGVEQEEQVNKASQLIKDNLANIENLSLPQKMAIVQFGQAQTAYQESSSSVINTLSNNLLDGSTLDITLSKIGNVSLNNPVSISFYAIDFESKADIENIINQYNERVMADESLGTIEQRQEHVISYTDYVGLMMEGITVIINAITYVLIAFVSISLIVSSIMIGIIIYISVLERTKEIGVLRSVGASKKDIKRVFTAESIIIGFIAGVLGVGVTLLLNIPINIILELLAGISGVAKLPVLGAIALILISMSLTFVAGLIPAKIASKKDPVVALRSE